MAVAKCTYARSLICTTAWHATFPHDRASRLRGKLGSVSHSLPLRWPEPGVVDAKVFAHSSGKGGCGLRFRLGATGAADLRFVES